MSRHFVLFDEYSRCSTYLEWLWCTTNFRFVFWWWLTNVNIFQDFIHFWLNTTIFSLITNGEPHTPFPLSRHITDPSPSFFEHPPPVNPNLYTFLSNLFVNCVQMKSVQHRVKIVVIVTGNDNKNGTYLVSVGLNSTDDPLLSFIIWISFIWEAQTFDT